MNLFHGMKFFLTKGKVYKVVYICRNISSSPVIMERAIEMLENNPYFEKYAEKISKLQNTSREEFLNRAENAFKHRENLQESKHGFSFVANKGKTSLPEAAYAFAPQKKLDSIMKMELLLDRTPDEIKYIWTQHFLQMDSISGIMPLALFEKIQDKATKYPSFIFPLPRDHGYEFIYVQFAANEVHFTPLINYQAYQENAPECLTIVHYPDLSKEKGIVLMNGTFNKNVIDAKEAQFLANQITLYYGGDDPEKLKLLSSFHESPDRFRHMDLVEQIEKLDLSVVVEKKWK